MQLRGCLPALAVMEDLDDGPTEETTFIAEDVLAIIKEVRTPAPPPRASAAALPRLTCSRRELLSCRRQLLTRKPRALALSRPSRWIRS